MSKLFKKTLLVTILLFGIIATSTSVLSGWTLYNRMTDEYRSKGIAIATSIADSSVEILLNRDASTIQAIIDQFLEIDGISYVFVTDAQGHVISHTFVPRVPEEVLALKGDTRRTILQDLSIEGVGDVIDVATPILVGVAGTVHIGMNKEAIRAAIHTATVHQQSLMLAIFLISVGLAYLFVNRISQPLRALTDHVKQLASHDFSVAVEVPANIEQLPMQSKDEVGELAASFIHLEHTLHQSIEHLKEATAAKERIESELKIAHDIQMSIVPKLFPPFPSRPEFALHASLKPAREVGGDFYDFSLLDEERLCFTIGDVSGKGVPASLFMAVTKTLLKAAASRLSQPDTILADVNEELCQDNDSAMFVTVFFGILHIKSGELIYSNAGHNLPYLLLASDQDSSQDSSQDIPHVVPLEKTGGMALGVMEDVEYRTQQLRLRPGDSLFLYTDGVTEAMDCAGNLFSDGRLQDLLSHVNGAFPREIIGMTLDEVNQFSSGAEQSDDITLLALKYCQNSE